MSNIDMKSIMEKAVKATNTSKFQKQIEAKTDEFALTGNGGGKSNTVGGMPTSPAFAAAKFIEVLRNEIRSLEATSGFADGKLGATAVEALSQLDHGTPYKVGKHKYQIPVWFENDLRRDSLCTDEYDGIDNIAALLNSGYDAGHVVYGIWLHHSPFNIPSLQHRSGAHFIENAIRDYMGSYASDYGVTDIEVDDIYK